MHSKILPYLVCSLFIFTGCLNKTLEYLLSQKLSSVPSGHQEILCETPLESTSLYGNLSDKMLFLGFFPLHLVRIGNFIEQTFEQSVPIKEQTKYTFLSQGNDELLEKMLDNRNSVERTTALEILDCQKEPGTAGKYWATALSDKAPYVKIVALHNLQDKKKKLLYSIKMLTDSDEVIRLEAIKVLALFRDRTVLPYLYQSLKDPSPLVRAEGAKTLGKIGFLASVDYLWDLLADHELYVRKQAAQSLTSLTGRNIGYQFYELSSKNRQKIILWRLWWQQKVRAFSKQH